MCVYTKCHIMRPTETGLGGDQSEVSLRFWRILMRFCYYLSPGAARSDAFKGCANDAAKTHLTNGNFHQLIHILLPLLFLFVVVI